jgi:hypothetical protein
MIKRHEEDYVNVGKLIPRKSMISIIQIPTTCKSNEMPQNMVSSKELLVSEKDTDFFTKMGLIKK